MQTISVSSDKNSILVTQVQPVNTIPISQFVKQLISQQTNLATQMANLQKQLDDINAQLSTITTAGVDITQYQKISAQPKVDKMESSNGYVKWSVFRWAVGAVSLVIVILVGYMVTNDSKRECDKDRIIDKLGTIQVSVDAVRIEAGPFYRQVDINTKRLDILECVKAK